MKRRTMSLLLNSGLFLIGLTTLAPVLWMLSASFMPSGEAGTFPPPLFPSAPTLEHYAALTERLSMMRYFLNSFIIAGSVTVVSTLLNSMAGFAFAKYQFAGRDRLFGALLSGMVVPAQVTMLPLFLMMKEMGFVNTYVGAVIPGMASIFGIFLIRQFVSAIPDSLIEAARIDGGSEFRIYRTVILPLCKPILLTLALFTFMGTWNDFMWPLIIMTDQSNYTLQVGLANLMGEHVLDLELMMAGSVVTIIPVLALFLVFQKHYVRGIMVGGVKE
ncbi:MAG: carbohydrate ABC transporter permease [Bacteroidetes bacterium]|nr:MAG: carbohydrate ABC transporter permease [Bacteroidota bacterium]